MYEVTSHITLCNDVRLSSEPSLVFFGLIGLNERRWDLVEAEPSLRALGIMGRGQIGLREMSNKILAYCK